MNRTTLRRILAEEGLRTSSEEEADKLDAKAEADEDQAQADRAKADAARMAGIQWGPTSKNLDKAESALDDALNWLGSNGISGEVPDLISQAAKLVTTARRKL